MSTRCLLVLLTPAYSKIQVPLPMFGVKTLDQPGVARVFGCTRSRYCQYSDRPVLGTLVR